ncbi:MAG: hypothetical protein H6565_02370 [Lewinellaceae bacterium]|nr:hypothetical protein [Lewinellaceae bacterium]
MMRSLPVTFLSFWVYLLFALGLSAQVELPKIYPTNLSIFDIDAGLPISCTNNGVFDPTGRLWINPCSGQEEHRTVSFYQFNGYESTYVEWPHFPDSLRGQSLISGVSESGELFGYFRDSGTGFFFNPKTQKPEFYKLDTAEAAISFIGHTKSHGLIIYALSPANHLVFQFRQGHVQLLKVIPRHDPSFRFLPGNPDNTLLTETDLWIAEPGETNNSGMLIMLNLATLKIRTYTLSNLFHGMPPSPSRVGKHWILAQGQANMILLYLAAWGQYFLIDSQNGSVRMYDPFQKIGQMRSFMAGDLFTKVNIRNDQAGNLLYFLKKNDSHLAILQDKKGLYYDYTPVLNAAREGSRNPRGGINSIQSANFLKQAYLFMAGGLAVVDLKYSSSISIRLEETPVRGIAEIAPGRYFTFPEPADWFVQFSTGPGTSGKSSAPLNFDCLHSKARPTGPRHLVDIVKDAAGNFWTSFDNQLVRFQVNGSCTGYFVGKDFMKFAFVDTATVVLAAEDQLYVYHIPNRKLTPVQIDNHLLRLNGFVNQIYVDNDGIVWVAALDGLHRVNLKTGAYNLFGKDSGFSDNRIMCIEKDDTGRLWIGTYGGGVQIFNPRNGEVSVVDQKNELSNNIVVGILSDSSGVHWVSTFEGLNLVSPKGKVLSRLYKEDGLSSNEFNRYSCLKSSTGELLFGSISGINIINPEALKDQILVTTPVHIFLTRLSFYDGTTDSLVNRTYWSGTVETIKLPAAHRSISLQFALSSLVRIEENNFAYKLEGPDYEGSNEWIYIGTNNSLNLQSLPAGAYRIMIRGYDYRGTGTTDLLVIPIYVAEFFYYQSWFILLCTSLVAALIIVWVYRQQIKRKHLEEMLQERSQEIMSTRNQLVVQEKLASLGQLTAGIAHEIKNPLNFINNFAMDSARLADTVLAKLNQAGKIAGSDPYKRMTRFLEIMKQNALDIEDNGAAANRIVRSMMNHARGASENMQPLDLNHLVEEAAHLALSGFQANHEGFAIALNESYDPSIGSIYGSPLNLSRALLNILNNACYALYEKKQQTGDAFNPGIHIETKAVDETVEIRIRDNGPGIDPGIAGDIFQPFFTTKPPGEGNTGLGLSITQDIIVNEHGGQLELNSDIGKFTEFIIKIPVHPESPSSSTAGL